MSSVSLAMIVKNEQFNLFTCLDRIKDIVDEIIVVDTGSSDRTIDIAKGFGASVYNYPWNDDFSGARNFSLDKCRGDWILVLDGDEFIDELSKPLIRELIKTGDFCGFTFSLVSYLNTDFTPDFLYEDVVRLFPNDPSLRYYGTVGEKIISSNNDKSFKIIPSEIKIWHYGYIDPKNPRVKKEERNLAIHLKNLKENPDEPIENFFTARTYFSLFKYKDAFEYAEKAINYSDDNTPYYPEMLSFSAEILTRLKNYSEAVNRSELSISKKPSGEAFYNLGEALRYKGEYDRAIINLEKAMEFKDYLPFQDNTKSTWKCCIELGHCYLKKADYSKGIEAFLKSLIFKPFFSPVMITLARIYVEKGDLLEGEKYFRRAYEQEFNRSDIVYELYDIYKRTGRFDLGASILEDLYVYNNDNYSLLWDVAEAFNKKGDNNKAIHYYTLYIEKNTTSLEACMRRGICFFRAGNMRKAKKDFAEIIKKKPELLKKVFLDELLV